MTAGNGHLETFEGSTLKLVLDPQPRGYSLAQADDYHALPRSDFYWRPPLRLSLRAHASTQKPMGTLGFGFWNDPFSLSIGQPGAARRLPTSPQALWFFFGSPPHDLALAPPVPGYGWKAAVLRSPSIPGLILAPAALAAMGAAQIPLIRRWVMNTAIRAVDAEEAVIDVQLDSPHDYEILWKQDSVEFYVDGSQALRSEVVPPAPLGFVTWIDNQYAIASPESGFRFGVLPTQKPQALTISKLQINDTALSLAELVEA